MSAPLTDDGTHIAYGAWGRRDGSPVLLVQGDMVKGVPAQIADGYHRICASYHLDEDADIPCRMAGDPAS